MRFRRWIYALLLVSGIAITAIVPLLPQLAKEHGLAPSETGVLLALPGFAMLLVSVPAGVAADRFGAARCTLLAGLLLCVSCAAQATPSLALLLVGRLVFGIAFGALWTTGLAWLSQLDPGGGALGPSVTCSSVGTILGPAVGGLLGGAGTTGLPFLLIAVACAIVVVPLLTGGAWSGSHARACASESRCSHVEATSSVVDDEPSPGRGALAGRLRQPGVLAATGALIISGAVLSANQLLIPEGLQHDGLSTGRIGVAFSAAAAAYIVASFAVVRLDARVRTLRFNALATMGMVFAMVPAVLSSSIFALTVTMMASAVSRAVVGTICYALASGGSDANGGHGADGPADGSVFGIINGAWAASMVLMPLSAGALDQYGSGRLAWLGVIVPAAAIALALLIRSRPPVLMTQTKFSSPY
jgi:MFS family permease